MLQKEVSVSVIIPCFNSSKTILKALDSLFNQTNLALEIICIDDFSSDETVRIIQEYINDHPDLNIKIFKNSVNAGPSASRNLGWNTASSDYIAFLDSDNAWHPQKVELQYNWMLQHPNVSLSGHAPPFRKTDPDSSGLLKLTTLKLNLQTEIESKKLSKLDLLEMNPFETSSVMVKRSIPHRFDVNKRYCEDYFLWMQIVFDNYEIYRLSTLLTFVYQTPNSLSSNRWKMRVGDIDNYVCLWKVGNISTLDMSIRVLYSLLKFTLFIVSPQIHLFLREKTNKGSTI